MHIEVVAGDVLAQSADILICPANCYLNMSGGVNGEILLRGGEAIQRELHEHLTRLGLRSVPPATVVRTGAASLPFRRLLHVVAVDAFYDSSTGLVTAALRNAFEQAQALGARSIALPALATGYGPLSIADFCFALRDAANQDWSPLETATLVLRRHEDVASVRQIIAETPS